MSKKKTLKHLDRADQRLSALLRHLDSRDNATLNQQPSTGGWSVIQIMHHLILAEKASLGYVQKKLSFNPTLKKAGIAAEYRLQLVNLLFLLPKPFQAPAGVGDEALPKEADYQTTKEEWLNNRRALRAFLADLPDERFGRELYKHPLAGKMTLSGMVRFFGTHVKRHLGQIDRTLKDVEA
ncbi:DinB family protein [Phaeodactylibacter luteus]|uniref:DinB family protein n=1 Tax=Phaeodactylibacter luteus TaxID=1564516 RepID=A0A5C6RVU9_9BACT|nr:DinB family protein [Phaeodactylibacter luteus]TXB66491.1 DinB family protein [Phaeodactylibacter luteus]